MASEYLMGFDIGGSNVRCLVYNIQTGESWSTKRSWSHAHDPECGQWALDLDTQHLWRILGNLSKATLNQSSISPKEVIGLASSSMRHSLVLLDNDGDVIFATPNVDARANSHIMDLIGDQGRSFYQQTGRWPSPIFLACRLLWLSDNRPEILNAIQSAFCLSDWVNYRLTGKILAERSQAAESMLFELESEEWAEDLIESLGLRREIFPPLGNAGSVLGSLNQEAADHLGLVAGIPVSLGGADTQSGLLGLGAIRPDQLAIISGSTTPIQAITDKPLIDEKARIWTGLHLIPGHYVLESNAGAMGSSLSWFAEMLYPESHNPVGRFTAEAMQAPLGAQGMFSTVGGTVFNASQMSLPIETLSFSPYNLKGEGSGRAALARSILEGMAYAVRANIEQIQEVSGANYNVVWMGGGMVKSSTWRQVVSEVLDCSVRFGKNSETTALGAVICAGVGAGVYQDLKNGVDAVVKISAEQAPDPNSAKLYAGYYEDWKALKEERKDADLLASNFMIESISDREWTKISPVESVFRPRIYVSADLGEGSLDHLREFGEVTYASYRDEDTLLVGEDLVDTISGYHVFITEVDILDAEALQQLPDLRVVISCRGNPVNVDIQACTAAGVLVLNTPGRNAEAVAELTMSYMLMFARKMPEAVEFLRQPGGEPGDMGRMGMAYNQLQGHELWGKTLGLIGAGAVGQEVIKRALPFGMRILVYDPFLRPDQITLQGAESAALEELLAESDFVSLHASVTADTRGMINFENLKRMKDGAYLINTARAALLDETALREALMSGKLGGAALDVFSVEPPGSEDPLLAIPNLIATPHIGGNTHEVASHQGEILVRDLKCILSGAHPKNILNPEVLPSFTWTGERVVMREVLEELAHGPGPGVSDLEVEAENSMKDDLKAITKTRPPSSTEMDLEPLGEGKRKDMSHEQEISLDSEGSMKLNEIREKLNRILELFTQGIQEDADILKFAQGRDVVFRFTIKTLDVIFFMDFQDGIVKAGMGEPEREPDVHLKMSADTLDGMFTKRIKAMSAAMSGKLSFSGNTKKAMAFQRIQKEMQRLYQEAREAIGDPGDLKEMDRSSTQGLAGKPSGVSKKGSKQAPISIPTSYKVGDVRDEILQVNNELYVRHYITPTGGNVSARVDDNPNEVWITPSQIFKGDLHPEMMLRIDLDGNLIGESEFTASSERRVHCAIYRTRPDVMAVVHSHAPQATLLVLAGLEFLPLSTEAAMIGDIPVVPFIMPGSDELGEAVAQALGNGMAVLMQNHGLVVAAETLRRAADVTDIIEVTAEKIITCKKLGIDPAVLPEDVVETLREISGMVG